MASMLDLQTQPARFLQACPISAKAAVYIFCLDEFHRGAGDSSWVISECDQKKLDVAEVVHNSMLDKI